MIASTPICANVLGRLVLQAIEVLREGGNRARRDVRDYGLFIPHLSRRQVPQVRTIFEHNGMRVIELHSARGTSWF